ncbi:unnamed protein product [Psylliodes chrysocephalus]|uniref:Uncharacterized protein n=1 Tax=Psylliodes chrysocephalus TaxID=3402493 RepID=A0A9P0G1W5_9CUCU|nr:unnamed protein product [Psylliodes chrysocephala]
MGKLRPLSNDTLAAILPLKSNDADKILEKGSLQVGLVKCRVETRLNIRRCQKSWLYEHYSDTCNGPDRSNNCFKCGQSDNSSKESIAKSLGYDVSINFVTSSTVYRARVVNRGKMARKIEETLFENSPPLVLHWDGKLLLSVTHGNVKTLEDRVVVLVTDKDFKHLLGVPVAQKGTVEQKAKETIS